jgi:single-stranded-DNA-specific exonuclease
MRTAFEGMASLWTIAPRREFAVLPDGVSQMMAHCLSLRGFETEEKIAAFMSNPFPRYDPCLLSDMSLATNRLRSACTNGERIGIIGDFDTDGLTASAIIRGVLVLMGAEPHVIIPTRNDGHGIRSEHLRAFKSNGVSLVLSVDCGINEIERVREARDLGLDVIISDHHEPNQDGTLPDCLVVAASRIDSTYPFRHLSGAGIAFKFAEALLGPDESQQFLDLTALGTVADVVPLRDENRTLTRRGLDRLKESQRPGIIALYQVSSARRETTKTDTIGYMLGPRLNSANRMADPRLAYDLLTTEDLAEAIRLAQQLDSHNDERKDRVDEFEEQIFADLGPAPQLTKSLFSGEQAPIICVYGDWRPGLSGLLAARIAERYKVPAFAAATKEDGLVSASARSVDDVNVLEVLRGLDSFAIPGYLGGGGHSSACGFTCERSAVESVFEALRQVARITVPIADLGTTITVDARIRLGQVDLRALQQVEELEPYGEGFPEPAFLIRGVYLRNKTKMGHKSDKHFKATACSGQTRVCCLLFRCPPELQEYPDSEPIDLIVNIVRDDIGGTFAPALKLVDWRPYDGD